jgi:hypothetical protein
MFFERGATLSVNPGCGLAWLRRQRVAECAGRTGEHQRRHAFSAGGLQQVECASDVGVDKILARVGRHMRLVKGGGMQDDAYARHVPVDEIPISDRAGELCEGAGLQVDADDVG